VVRGRSLALHAAGSNHISALVGQSSYANNAKSTLLMEPLALKN
jgi:hypothetical protein